ncbi:hypothetical protein HTZ84_21210 [Haloterrigena sp. SYSU A558-1]|uniref:Uncharacterized protein n=1 Tax=Haloterrigena gelatinilytica TaxID=2741724 RepID=A0ABX2LEV3_9EURY|nr:hypothetical protein [Haloterrigena gelatinilytica]NUC74785.1 hypothetical protein [Haloterrigena gelatinilytica]
MESIPLFVMICLVLTLIAPDHVFMWMFVSTVAVLGMPWLIVGGPLSGWLILVSIGLCIVMFRLGVEKGDRPHWLKQVVFLAVPTTGLEIEDAGQGGPEPESEPGRNPDSQGRLGLLDAILGGGPQHDQRQQGPRNHGPPPQDAGQDPRPEQMAPDDYEVVPDEELFGDVDAIEDQYRQ